MSCLNPPLARKPSKGFAWQCAYCTRQEVLAESSSSNPQSPASCSLESSSTIKHTSPDLDHPPTKAELKRQTRATRSQVSIKPTSTQPQPEQAKSEPQLKVHNKKVPKSKYRHVQWLLIFQFPLFLLIIIFSFKFFYRSTNNHDTYVAVSLFRCQYKY